MEVLNLYALSGLYDELYYPDWQSLDLSPLAANGPNSLARANGLFWGLHLHQDRLAALISELAGRYRYTTPDSPAIAAVLKSPDQFIGRALMAPVALSDASTDPRTFFSALETLTIVCSIYSDVLYYPHTLTVQEGFRLPELSSLRMSEIALSRVDNPYLPFIEEHCLPIIKSVKPGLIWIRGRIRVSTLAMAALAKVIYPEIHVSVASHSSEYYSLNKIGDFLRLNRNLFKLVDSIVLNDYPEAEEAVRQCVSDRRSLKSTPGVIFWDSRTGSVVQNVPPSPGLKPKWRLDLRPRSSPLGRRSTRNDPGRIANVRLWADQHCYWDRCSFCGINAKYSTNEPRQSFGGIAERADFLSSLSERGIEAFWLIDEAIPPDTLGELAAGLLERGTNMIWQARSRIDPGFTPDTCALLARSGLREIRLGLESASSRILALMKKFPSGFDLPANTDRIVKAFSEQGVSVHFPTIVDFPTETEAERLETFEFLRELRRKYPDVTFNVNALMLDVSSELFKGAYSYGISSTRFPCDPRDFLGNFVDWEAELSFDRGSIEAQRNAFMRQELYPWMPRTASTPPVVFYRLSETSRMTLVWKASGRQATRSIDSVGSSAPLRKCENAACWNSGETRQGQPVFQFYDLDSHNQVKCSLETVKLIDLFSAPRTVREAIEMATGQRASETKTTSGMAEVIASEISVAYENHLLVPA